MPVATVSQKKSFRLDIPISIYFSDGLSWAQITLNVVLSLVGGALEVEPRQLLQTMIRFKYSKILHITWLTQISKTLLRPVPDSSVAL